MRATFVLALVLAACGSSSDPGSPPVAAGGAGGEAAGAGGSGGQDEGTGGGGGEPSFVDITQRWDDLCCSVQTPCARDRVQNLPAHNVNRPSELGIECAGYAFLPDGDAVRVEVYANAQRGVTWSAGLGVRPDDAQALPCVEGMRGQVCVATLPPDAGWRNVMISVMKPGWECEGFLRQEIKVENGKVEFGLITWEPDDCR